MGKKQFSARIDEEILENAKDIVYWNPGLSLGQFVETALKEIALKYKAVKKRPSRQLRPGPKV